MANNKNVITQDKMISMTYDKLVNSGINLSQSMVELVIKAYSEVKFEKLTAGLPCEEPRIGTILPGWRRISKAFAPRDPFTPKLTIQMEPELKDYLQVQLRNSPEFREAVGAQEL